MKIELTPEQVMYFYNLGKCIGFKEGMEYEVPAYDPCEIDFIKMAVYKKKLLTPEQFDEVFKDV